MRLVSVESFIKIIFESDEKPPAPSTIRRHCSQFNTDGSHKIPGAYKIGKAWKIDMDTYVPEIERRMVARTDVSLEDRAFIEQFSQGIS